MRVAAVAPAALVMLTLAACGTGSGSSSSDGAGTTSTAATMSSGAPGTATGDTSPAAAIEAARPARLATTRGYGAYEACQGTCTGAVPRSLRRPLHLPPADGGPCPITVHVTGPVTPREISAGVGFHRVSASSWLGAQVTWIAAGTYRGPLLIRGALLGGTRGLGFGTGAVPYDELQLMDAGRGAPEVSAGGRAWVTYTRAQEGGCYAYQVDGTTFSEVVVFRAVA